MEYQIYNNGKVTRIELATSEISSGGQGRIFKIQNPWFFHGYCAKIYKDAKHASSNREKIEYMVVNKPTNKDMANIRICWPKYIIYNNQSEFCGYVMPLAFDGSRDLKIIEIYSVGKTIEQKYPKFPEWHKKYELDTPQGFINRIKMLHNWALATEIIHNSGKYIIVDLKPENVLATPDGRISVVDTDSFQIVDGAKNFPGPVATPEYFAKFAKERHSKKMFQTFDCDNFALAVSFYKILVGTHPYSGFKLLPPYDTDEYSDIASRIDAELFVFGKNRSRIELLKQNNLHERFFKLPQILQTLFMQAFTQEQQPSSTIWKQALKSILSPGNKVRIPHTKIDINSSANSEMRCLCVLLVDVSGSMKLCEDTINISIKNFMSDLLHGRNGFKEYSKEQIELAIVQFDSDVKVLRLPSLVKRGDRLPVLQVRGLNTNTVGAVRKAMSIIENRKIEHKMKGLSYYRPWIILLTDGNPNPCSQSELQSLLYDVSHSISENKFMLTAIGIGNSVDKEFLSAISNNNYHRIGQANISTFFQALSASMTMKYGNDPQNNLSIELDNELQDDI